MGGASRPGWEGRHVHTVISRSERTRLRLRFFVPLLGPGLPGPSQFRELASLVESFASVLEILQRG